MPMFIANEIKTLYCKSLSKKKHENLLVLHKIIGNVLCINQCSHSFNKIILFTFYLIFNCIF